MQKWILVIAGIIVAVVILATGGVFAYQYYSKANPTISESVSPSPSSLSNNPQMQNKPETATPDAKVVVPVNWKTYSQNQYGFEFKYPGDYFQQTNLGGQKSADPLLGNSTNILHFPNYGDYYIDFAVSSSGSSYENIKDGIAGKNGKFTHTDDQGTYNLTISSPTSTKIAGVGASSYNGFIHTSSLDCVSNMVLLPQATTTLSITLLKCGDVGDANLKMSESEKTMFSQILSSFKFTK